MKLIDLLSLSEAQDSKVARARSKATLSDPSKRSGEREGLAHTIRRADKVAAKRAKDAANRGERD